jgi:hypothetical protein
MTNDNELKIPTLATKIGQQEQVSRTIYLVMNDLVVCLQDEVHSLGHGHT